METKVYDVKFSTTGSVSRWGRDYAIEQISMELRCYENLADVLLCWADKYQFASCGPVSVRRIPADELAAWSRTPTTKRPSGSASGPPAWCRWKCGCRGMPSPRSAPTSRGW